MCLREHIVHGSTVSVTLFPNMDARGAYLPLRASFS